MLSLDIVQSQMTAHFQTLTMNPTEWNDPSWLYAPGAPVVDDFWDVLDTVDADYQEERALRLFKTIERRLACCAVHFHDFTADTRVLASMKSELVST